MVHLLVNVVSENGNLLLNIPLPGHGRPDGDELAFLDKFGAWMALNGEAIYSTRPWKISGEGPAAGVAAVPYAGLNRAFTPADIRFTSKGETLYAIALAWPGDRKLLIQVARVEFSAFPRGDRKNWAVGVRVKSDLEPHCGWSCREPPGEATRRLRLRFQNQLLSEREVGRHPHNTVTGHL
jgi:alpha-L-fucosidase